MLTILFDGIAYGMLLFVLACGLAVTLGLMNFVNLAHGAFAMAGGYFTVVLVNRLGVPFFAALPLAFLFSARRSAWCSSARSTCTSIASRHLDQVLFTIGLVFMSVAAVDYVMGSQPGLRAASRAGCRARFDSSASASAATGCCIIVVCGLLTIAPAVHPREHALRQPAARRGRRRARRARARHQRQRGVRRSPSRSARGSPASAARSARRSSGSIRPSRSSS